MSHFRARPVVIEAVQWDGTIHSYDAINHWAGTQQTDKQHDIWRDRIDHGQGSRGDMHGHLVIHTRIGGDLRAEPHDWIVRGVDGELHPWNPTLFAATYEPISEPR